MAGSVFAIRAGRSPPDLLHLSARTARPDAITATAQPEASQRRHLPAARLRGRDHSCGSPNALSSGLTEAWLALQHDTVRHRREQLLCRHASCLFCCCGGLRQHPARSPLHCGVTPCPAAPAQSQRRA